MSSEIRKFYFYLPLLLMRMYFLFFQVLIFGLNIDFLVKSKAGQIIGGQENFKSVSFVSNVRNRELMLNLSMRVTGVPPGEYVLEWKLRDQFCKKNTEYYTKLNNTYNLRYIFNPLIKVMSAGYDQPRDIED